MYIKRCSLQADARYPRPLAKWWYGCAENSNSNSLVAPGVKEDASDDKSQFIGVSVAYDGTTASDDDVTMSDTSSASVVSSLSLVVCFVLASFVTAMTTQSLC